MSSFPINFLLENDCHHLFLVPSWSNSLSTRRMHSSSRACLKYALKLSLSLLLDGWGYKFPNGQLASPGIANCFLDNSFNSLNAVGLSSIFSHLTKHWHAYNVKYINVLSAPFFTSKLRNKTLALKYVNNSSIISSPLSV